MATEESPDQLPSDPPTEAELRKQLLELDRLMDEARRDPAAGNLFALAAERDDIMTAIRDLDPADAELGDQHNPEQLTPKHRPFIASPSDYSGGS